MESIWNNFFDPQPRPRLSPAAVREPAPITRPPVKRSPKLVSVPVRFASSDRRRSDAAAKIQKALRGFLTRRSVKRIAAAKREVDEIHAAISLPETAEKIRRDPKERLRLNETLMSSLLKLDSVRSVVPGVRDCRKAVIKKAIALQERIDAIAAGASSSEESEAPEKEEEEEDEPLPVSSDPRDHKDDDENEARERSTKSDGSSQSDSSAAEEKSGGGERRGSEDLMGRMLEDNERLMGLMAELYEQSSAQTRLLNSLSQRVEQLERAFLCEKLRKKKKQRRGCDAKNNTCGN